MPLQCQAVAGDYDRAEQVGRINSSYSDTGLCSSDHRSADQHCACQRLPCFTEFARPEWQVVVLPIGLAYATQMLVFASDRNGGGTCGGTGDNRSAETFKV
jgi:hypothetical protein